MISDPPAESEAGAPEFGGKGSFFIIIQYGDQGSFRQAQGLQAPFQLRFYIDRPNAVSVVVFPLFQRLSLFLFVMLLIIILYYPFT